MSKIVNYQPQSSGLDYTPKKIANYISAGGAGLRTILSVTNGKGFLSKAVCYVAAAILQELKITIDGVVVIYTSNKSVSGNMTGYLKPSHLIMSGGQPYAQMYNAIKSFSTGDYSLEYPQPSVAANGNNVLMNLDIPFNTSLLIEISNNSNAAYEIEYSLKN